MSEQSATATLAAQLTNNYTRHLPGDDSGNVQSRQVPGVHWSSVQPKPFAQPQLIAWSQEMAVQLGLDIAANPQAFADFFCGQTLHANSTPYAMRYGGHQFGNWAGQLGDGRAITLGETLDTQQQHWTLQLKGAGPTPYSRSADGLAVLRSSIREFLCSEAMYHLGIPTTRALSLCLTGEQVIRDVFYDGNQMPEPGAIVCRTAPSFVRFGNFEIHAAHQEIEQLKALVDHVISRDYAHLGKPGADVYQQWFAEVLQRTAKMIVEWQRVGFVHAVMNTDNMSIIGDTIDYGPFGWLEEYDPDWTPNYIDAQARRYRYGNQPEIARWNLYRLANALVPIFDSTEPLEEVLNTWPDIFDPLWHETQANKLGIKSKFGHDSELFESLWKTLRTAPTDFTIFFRQLATIRCNSNPPHESMFESIQPAFYKANEITEPVREKFTRWLVQWCNRVTSEKGSDEQRQQAMEKINPLYVLRNYISIKAIDAAEKGDFDRIHETLEVMRKPYVQQTGREEFAKLRPDWATQRPGCTMLTCSS